MSLRASFSGILLFLTLFSCGSSPSSIVVKADITLESILKTQQLGILPISVIDYAFAHLPKNRVKQRAKELSQELRDFIASESPSIKLTSVKPANGKLTKALFDEAKDLSGSRYLFHPVAFVFSGEIERS